jgi:hemin uptake protein HemP
MIMMVHKNMPIENSDAGDSPCDLAAKVIDAKVLLDGRREVWIEWEGVRYRLRLTRRNRLILQK